MRGNQTGANEQDKSTRHLALSQVKVGTRFRTLVLVAVILCVPRVDVAACCRDYRCLYS